jgi:hypothetical protein
MILLNLLTTQNIISELEARAIEDESKKSPVPIDEILSEHNVPDVAILTARNAIHNVPVYNGAKDLADKSLYDLIDRDKAERYLAIPLGFKKEDIDFFTGQDRSEISIPKSREELGEDFIKNKNINEEVLVGIVDPEKNNCLDALQFILTSAGVTYKIYLISLSEFKRRFAGYATDGLGAIPQYSHKKDDGEVSEEKIDDITEEDETIAASLIDSAPTQKVVNIFLKNAITSGASDIHIEHVGDHVRTRNRVDGVLNT